MTAEKNRSSETERYRNMYSLIRMMCDNAPDLIWAKDLEGRYLFANQAICDVLLNARDTDEPIGKTDLYFACRERDEHPEDPDWHTFGEVCVDSDQVVLTSKRAGRFDEFGNVRGKFLRLDVHKVPFFDADGELIGTVGCGRDVTKEKEMEAALRQSEQRYRALIEQSAEAILLMDIADNQIVEINPACCRLLGFSRDELLGQSLWTCSLDDAETIEKAQRCSLSPAGQQQPMACVYRHKNGVLIYVEQTGSIVELDGRRLFLASLRDVTAEHKRQQKISQELKLARDLQKATLREFPPAMGVTVRTVYEAVGAVSGDIYLLEWVVPERVFRGYIADVIGHDIAAALVTSAMSVLLHEAAEMRISLAEQLDWIHHRTLKSFPEDFFVAVAAIEVDLDARQLRYATAGINQFWQARQGKVERIAAPSLFLSVTENPDLCAGEVELQPGDIYYFPTDGLTDLMKQEETGCFVDFDAGVAWLERLAVSPLRRDDATAICIRIEE